MLKNLQNKTILVVSKSPKGWKFDKQDVDGEIMMIMSDILSLPATWRRPVEVHISPLVSLVPPVWCPAPWGKRKLAPATVHFGENLFLNKTVFCCFPLRLFRLGGNWESSKDAGELPLSSWILFLFCRLRFGLRCPLLSRGPSPQSELFHSSLSLCSPVYSCVTLTLNKCLKETFSLFVFSRVSYNTTQHNTTNKAHNSHSHLSNGGVYQRQAPAVYRKIPVYRDWTQIPIPEFLKIKYRYFSGFWYSMCVLKLPAREDAKSHWLHLFDFSPLCVFKCLLKLPAWEDAKSHWLHLFGFSPLCVFKCALKWVFKLSAQKQA